MFCAKILPPNNGYECVPTLEGTGGFCYFDVQAEYTCGKYVFCLVILEARSGYTPRYGLLLARPKPEREEYVRVGVWRQYPKEGQKDLVSNAEEKTIFLI